MSLSVPGGTVRAVDGVDLTVMPGETHAILGESGCGKSMTALSILRLLPAAGRVVDGSVRLDGTDLLRLPEDAMRAVRGRRVAMIFQEPQSSLNPVLTVGTQMIETIVAHEKVGRREASERAVAALRKNDVDSIPITKYLPVRYVDTVTSATGRRKPRQALGT